MRDDYESLCRRAQLHGVNGRSFANSVIDEHAGPNPPSWPEMQVAELVTICKSQPMRSHHILRSAQWGEGKPIQDYLKLLRDDGGESLCLSK